MESPTPTTCPMSDLEALNPGIDINRLMVGDVLNVKELTPVLSVQTVEEVTIPSPSPARWRRWRTASSPRWCPCVQRGAHRRDQAHRPEPHGGGAGHQDRPEHPDGRPLQVGSDRIVIAVAALAEYEPPDPDGPGDGHHHRGGGPGQHLPGGLHHPGCAPPWTPSPPGRPSCPASGWTGRAG